MRSKTIKTIPNILYREEKFVILIITCVDDFVSIQEVYSWFNCTFILRSHYTCHSCDSQITSYVCHFPFIKDMKLFFLSKYDYDLKKNSKTDET